MNKNNLPVWINSNPVPDGEFAFGILAQIFDNSGELVAKSHRLGTTLGKVTLQDT